MQPAKQPTTQQDPNATRRRIRTDGSQSLSDVARLACGDIRLVALLHDLNPALPQAGRLPLGTHIVCPSKSEVQAFAKKMDFVVGMSPDGSNGTAARRAWAAHVGKSREAAPVGGEALARALLARGVGPAEAGRRLATQCAEAELGVLLRHTDPRLRAVGEAAELHALFPKARSRLGAVRSILEATGRPAGFRAVLEACGRAPEEAERALASLAVSAPLRKALREEAPRVVALLEQARRLTQLERGARDASTRGQPELARLVEALGDGVEPLSPERTATLGLGAEAEALGAHCAQLQLAVASAESGLARSPEAIRALARGAEAASLPRPWPLLSRVCRELGALLDAAPATCRDEGLGGLVSRPAAPAPRVTVQALQARAAACARVDDEGDALAERLAAPVVELFGLLRPPPKVDGGPVNARRARRRAAFDQAVSARGEVSAAGAAALVTEALERARDVGLAPATRLTRQSLEAAAEVARGLQGSLSVQRRPMSELGRALVVAALALDRELSQALTRPTGREALTQTAQRHAARVLSAASCRLAAGA